ncbi:hypothetical protein ALC53_02589 [Atta colombica]|uniref:Uncharacterized protein n=1 Tax=Atta colombica TaxID=520822 RepID=A0A195BRI2_9HYME|nr:hypothetical protein ALC53_02589 [Atta colombica]
MSAYLFVEIVLLSGFWFCSWARGYETEEPTIYYLSFLEKVRINKRAEVLLADDGDALPRLAYNTENVSIVARPNVSSLRIAIEAAFVSMDSATLQRA